MRDEHIGFLERLTIKKNEQEDALDRLFQDQKEYRDQLASDKIADEFDNAQREISSASIYSLIDKKIKELKKIEHLIQKISRDEDFGICEECGEPIPTERLLIVPEANLCVPCQREAERFNRSRNMGNNTSNGLRIRKAPEWQDNDDDSFYGELSDTELEIFEEDDVNPGEARETSQDIPNIPPSPSVRSRQPKAHRV